MRIKGEVPSDELKRSPDEKHNKRALGHLTDMFRHSRRSFSIRNNKCCE